MNQEAQGKRFADCAIDYVAVDLSSTDFKPDQPFRAVYVGGEGDLVLVSSASGRMVKFEDVQPGIYPFSGRQILKTGTTATKLIALY